jgi:phosphatidylinositol alpha-mannosyltransferase
MGLAVFGRPRLGAGATVMQLGAWALQWLSCYVLLVALGLEGHADLGAAAAVLFAVNLGARPPLGTAATRPRGGGLASAAARA